MDNQSKLSFENYDLVWLDDNSVEKKSEQHRNTIEELRHIINTIDYFTDVDECIEFITDSNKDKIFVIVSGSFSETIVSIIQDISQVNSVYILTENENGYGRSTLPWTKVKDSFTNMRLICEALKQVVHQCDRNLISISFVKPTDQYQKPKLDELDKSFMYTQILKEILLTIDFRQTHINEFLIYCREQFTGDISRLNYVDKLEKEYHHHKPIWWYSSPGFLYTMLNEALRNMKVHVIIQLGFFIRDLHEHIAELHSKQYDIQVHSKSFTVFRGQGFSQIDFNRLRKTSGGLISFNNFLSTSLNEAVSTAFAESNTSDPNLIGILFKITINPSIPSTPFSNVTGISYFEDEEEILFSMHSVFRIGQIKQINGNSRLWQVDLTLTGDDDSELRALTECIREETFPRQEGWYRLGQVLIKLGEFKKAEQVYNALLHQTSHTFSTDGIYFHLGWIKDNQGEYEQAVSYYEKSAEIIGNTLPINYYELAFIYNNTGLVYNKMSEYEKALDFHTRALGIRQNKYLSNDGNLATSYNNIGRVYHNMGKYSQALSYYEKAFDLWQKILPSIHSNLALCHNNICVVHINMNNYSKALSHIQKAHEIQRRILPANHPDLVDSCNNIGGLCAYMGQYSEAVSYFNEAMKIRQETAHPYHPKLAVLYNNIASMYDKKGEHWKALFYFQTAHIIKHKTLSPDHHQMGTSYNNIGIAYRNLGKPLIALACFKKALKIFQVALQPNHPDLIVLYSSIGVLYSARGNFQEAFEYHEKALKISEQTLPPNHPGFVTFYHNMGGLYHDMGDYSKALSFYERALDIGQRVLPENHPTLRTVRRTVQLLRTNSRQI